MISLLIQLLVLLLVVYVVYYIIGLLPLPPVIKQIALIILGLCVLFMLLGMFFPGVVGTGVGWRPLYR